MRRAGWMPLAFVIVVGLVLPAVGQQPSAAPQVLIVPGQSIAGVALGRTVSATLGRLGQPSEMRTLRDGALYTFPRYGINMYAADGAVRAVSTTNSLLRTAEGIALGSSLAEVRRVYGPHFSDAVVEGLMGIAYDQHGIAFGLDGALVSVIVVYPPRTQAMPPAAIPALAAPSTQIDVALTTLPRVENLKPFSPETQYMSAAGYLRYVVHQQTGQWLTHGEASRMLQEQLRARL